MGQGITLSDLALEENIQNKTSGSYSDSFYAE